MDRKQHWEDVYHTKSDQDVGWYQEKPEISLNLIERFTSEMDFPILDIGGGNSHLTQFLFEKGYTDLSVLDISAKAIERSKERLGEAIKKVTWIETDVLSFSSRRKFHTWHDRAVFHFLIEEKEIKKYAEVAANNIVKGGYLILGTFSLTGPKSCSGLPVTQYCEEDLCKIFEMSFKLVECFENTHITPSGNPQDYIWVVFKRK